MKIHECPQYETEWWALRRGVPSASEFHNIITAKTMKLSKSADQYICSLIGDLLDPLYPRTEDYVSSAMKNGTAMEPTVRNWYEFEADAQVRQVGCCITDDGRFLCSPDGLVGDDGGLECKSPMPKAQVGYALNPQSLVDDYQQQVHGALVVTGRAWWDIVSYCAGLPPVRVRVVPNDFTEALRAGLDEFWARYQELKGRFEIKPPPMRNMEPVVPLSERPMAGFAMGV